MTVAPEVPHDRPAPGVRPLVAAVVAGSALACGVLLAGGDAVTGPVAAAVRTVWPAVLAVAAFAALAGRAVRPAWTPWAAASVSAFAAVRILQDPAVLELLPPGIAAVAGHGLVTLPAFLVAVQVLDVLGSRPDDARLAGALESVGVASGLTLLLLPALGWPGAVAASDVVPVGLDLLLLTGYLLIIASRRALVVSVPQSLGFVAALAGDLLSGAPGTALVPRAVDAAAACGIVQLTIVVAVVGLAPARVEVRPEHLAARPRLALLWFALLAPAVLDVVMEWRSGDALSHLVVPIGLVVLVALVAARMTILILKHVAALERLGDSLAQEEELAEELRHLAMHDPLTGLANRVQLMAHAAGLAPSEDHVLVLVDLDDFKVVNDTRGHSAGDRLLEEVARRLLAAVRSDDLVARLSGDEFAILMPHCGLDGAERVAGAVAAALREPVEMPDGSHVSVGASVGIANLHGDPVSALGNADIAMYATKRQGKSGVTVFDDSMRAQVVREAGLGEDLQRALTDGEFRVVYQPIVDLDTQRLVALEALVRWDHPEHGTLGPGEFLHVAQSRGRLAELDLYVLDRAARAVAGWTTPQHPIRMHVNMSAALMARQTLEEDVLAVLRASGATGDLITLEVTEEHVVAGLGSLTARLEPLRALGVRVALDDFGVGYSSLAHLQALPVDVVKLDKTFVRAGAGVGQDGALLRGVVDLVRGLGLVPLAEGIETRDQLATLHAYGCALGQGFLWARPVDAGSVPAFLHGPLSVADDVPGVCDLPTQRTRSPRPGARR